MANIVWWLYWWFRQRLKLWIPRGQQTQLRLIRRAKPALQDIIIDPRLRTSSFFRSDQLLHKTPAVFTAQIKQNTLFGISIVACFPLVWMDLLRRSCSHGSMNNLSGLSFPPKVCMVAECSSHASLQNTTKSEITFRYVN